jgi:flagellar biosynthesis/type III secretory pathway chaperone
MNLPGENVAESLRTEIAEYGALLRLFEAQQQRLFARDADGVLQAGAAIEAQVAVLHDCRRRREQAAATFAALHGHPAAATLRSMLPSFGADARPLIEALVAEVNRLVHRTRRVTRHNHALLARAVETHQELVRALAPGAVNPTYSPSGRVQAAVTRTTAALRAAG